MKSYYYFFLSVSLVFLLLISNPALSQTPDGDVAPLGNRDGTVNVGDALVALRFALNLEIPTQEDIKHGDVAPLDAQNKPNPDGVINVGDALVILRKALGIIQFPSADTAPSAQVSATPESGTAPLQVHFDASGSSDPNGSIVSYNWDLDGDGVFAETDNNEGSYTDQSTAQYTYTTSGEYVVSIKVTDSDGLIDTATVRITVSAVDQKDKWSLWSEGTKLRGADIWQVLVIPGIYSEDTFGTGAVGPPFTQADFNEMVAMGANYVNISHPGLYTVTAPYIVDEGVQANLDSLLNVIAQADMFAVISFRTGPGRSEFTFNRDEVGDWFQQSDLIEIVWTDTNAQAAWAQMWRYVANRYKDNPIVAGYDLMVEPNAPEVLYQIWDPDEYYPTYAGSVHDWNKIYPPIVNAIREVDTKTPIIVACSGWSAVDWLPYLELSTDDRVLYAVHQYGPSGYRQYDPGSFVTYPGQLDLDQDGDLDPFNKATLADIMSEVDQFKADNGVPVVVNEFGPLRFSPGAAEYFRDMTDVFDQSGVNNALWEYVSAFLSGNSMITWDYMNFKHGMDPNNHTDVTTSELIQAIKTYWDRNSLRPSNWQ